jgi:hypothetical protein
MPVGTLLPAGTPDRIERKILFALELLDPITRLPVSDGIIPVVKGLAPPKLTPSRRFVWRDNAAPAQRDVTVALKINNRQYAPPPEAELKFNIPANDGNIRPEDLLEQASLVTTAHYRPVDGMMAVTGLLLENSGTKQPLQDCIITIEASSDGGNSMFKSRHSAKTDKNGEFVAVLSGLTDEKLDPDPQEPGTVSAWLLIKREQTIRAAALSPRMRLGKQITLTEPIFWAELP